MIISVLVAVITFVSAAIIELIRDKTSDIPPYGTIDENYRPTEMDKELIEKSREIITSHFPDGIESTMLALGFEARIEMIKQLTQEIVDAYGIDVDTLTFFGNEQSGKGLTAGFYNAQNKSIAINADLLAYDDGQLLREMIDTIIHECRHAFQCKAIHFPEECGVSEEQSKKWSDNFINYVSPDLDLEGYVYQPIEADARNFTSSVLQNL